MKYQTKRLGDLTVGAKFRFNVYPDAHEDCEVVVRDAEETCFRDFYGDLYLEPNGREVFVAAPPIAAATLVHGEVGLSADLDFESIFVRLDDEIRIYDDCLRLVASGPSSDALFQRELVHVVGSLSDFFRGDQ